MKKIFVILLLTAIAARSWAQVTFKFAYQPKTTYVVNKDVKMSLIGANPNPVAGAPANMNMLMGTNTTQTIATGARGQNGVMPIKVGMRVNHISVDVNGQPVPTGDMPKGDTGIYGKYAADGSLSIDSVSGKQVDESTKATMMGTVDALQKSIKFPDKPLSPGEGFTMEVPLTLPFPGLTGGNAINVKMTYKLLNIVKNIAVFTYTQEAIAIPDPQGHSTPMTIKGTGDGSFDYDIARQFYTSMTGNLEMTFTNTLNGVTASGKVSMVSVDKVVITGN